MTTSTEHRPDDGRHDIERAIADLGERLQEPLLPLSRIVFNYRWSWLHGGAAVFQAIDPNLWRRACCNRGWLSKAVTLHRLHEARDAAAVAARSFCPGG